MRSLHCAHYWVLCCNGRRRTGAVHLPYFLDHTRQHTCMVLQPLTLKRRSLVMPCPDDTISARVTHSSHTLHCIGRELPQSDRRIIQRRSSWFLVLWDQPTRAVCAGGSLCSHEWCIILPSPFAVHLPRRVRFRPGISRQSANCARHNSNVSHPNHLHNPNCIHGRFPPFIYLLGCKSCPPHDRSSLVESPRS